MGYHRAGFEVVGVDNRPQKHYPFEFHQADAFDYLRDHGHEFDVIHASPPCQSYSAAMKHLAKPQPMLIERLRDKLQQNRHPWIIENVIGAPLLNPMILCGTMFGLRIHRHRLFECSSIFCLVHECIARQPILNPHRSESRERIYAEFGRQDPEKLWRNEMGVNWMGRKEAREAIPPAYTEWIGKQLMKALIQQGL